MSVKAARGTKRVCQNCGSKFYDLNRNPITCPVCQSIFQQQESRQKAVAGNAVLPDDDDEAISPVAANVDIVSLDEVAEAENDIPEIDDDGLVDIDDDEETDLKADADEPFIEDEDDSGDDVSGLLGGSRDEEDEI